MFEKAELTLCVLPVGAARLPIVDGIDAILLCVRLEPLSTETAVWEELAALAVGARSMVSENRKINFEHL